MATAVERHGGFAMTPHGTAGYALFLEPIHAVRAAQMLIDEPVAVYLRAKGPGDVTAGDISPPAGVEILNDGLHLATLGKDANLEMEIRTDETTGQALAEAGIPFENGRLSVKGRTAVDMAHQTLTFVPQGQPLLVPPAGPLAAIHPRYWTVEDDVLTVGTKDDLGNPTTVGRWRRQAP
jgi:hypothetical protein